MKRMSSPLALAVLLLLVGLIYLPGLSGPPLLDDGNNLAPLGAIENGSLSIGEYVFGSREGALSRPVSNASFVVNWLLWGDNLMAFKAVNVLVHILCGWVVFFLARALLGIAYTQLDPQTIAAAALFTCAMWLLAPLFVSTVLYTVQRMAQLSALFTLLGLLCYVLGRQRRSALLLITALVMWPLALFSKENGALLPLLAALIEWWWLPGVGAVHAENKAQGSSAIDEWTRRTRIVLIGCISFTAVALIIKVAGEPMWLLGGYQGRDFSMTERLLTQGPVLLDYLGNLLLFPGSSALSVFRDDYPVARGFWTQPLTAVACLLWLAVVVAGICYRRHRALMHAVSFGLLFFLAAHLVESSVFPLELYFEHRNYLPAFGIFWALTSCGLWLLTLGTPRLIAILAVALVMLSALATVQRTVLWGNEANLYAHVTRTHPQSARAWLGLASIQFTHDRFDDAQRSLQQAALLMRPSAHAAIALQAIAAHCVARREVPQSLWQQLRAAPLLASDLFTSNALAWMAGAFRAGTCDAATRRGVRQILGELPSAPASWNATLAQLRDTHLRQVLGSP